MSGSYGAVITGPTGVGKSRLAHECWRKAAERGHPAIRAFATQASRSIPLGALAPLLTPTGVGRASLRLRRSEKGARNLRTVLLIDDVDLLDEASASLLEPLVTAGEIVLIGTLGSERAREHASCDIIANLQRVAIAPLSEGALGRLIELVLRGPVERRTVLGLHAASGGRPLYLRELVGAALANRQLVRESGLWRLIGDLTPPARLVELVRYRMSSLAEPDRTVLEDLALCGPKGAHLLPQASLRTLKAQGLIHTDSTDRSPVADLADPMQGQVLRWVVPSQRARRILLARAQQAETQAEERAEAALLQSTLWRLQAADSVAAERLVTAIGAARSTHNFPAALRLAEALVRERDDAESNLLLGEFRHACGYPREAEKALARALKLARTNDERLLGVVLRTQNLAQGLLRIKDAFAVNARAMCYSKDPELRDVLLANEASLWALAGNVSRSNALLEQLAEQPSERTRLISAVPRVYCLTETGRSREINVPWASLRQPPLCARADSIAHPALLQSASARALAEAGRLEDAESLARQAHDRAVDNMAGTAQIRAIIDLGWICYLRGRMTQARSWFASGISASRERDFLTGLWAGLAGQALVDAVTGNPTASDASWSAAQSLSPRAWQRPEAHLVQGWRSAASGRVGQARSLLLAGAKTAGRNGLLVLRSHLLFDVARLGEPHVVEGELNELARRCDNPSVALRARTARAWAHGHAEELERCADTWKAMSALLVAAETRSAAAAAYSRRSERQRAAECWEAAEQLVVLCGGARTPALTPYAIRQSLTNRELEVAVLAANGLRDAQIAEQLALSVRTVGNHLHRVYSKIGIRDRRHLVKALRGATTEGRTGRAASHTPQNPLRRLSHTNV